MRIGGGIRQAVGADIVREMVAATVRYGSIMAGEFWQMCCPHPIILKAAMNEDDGFAAAGLHIGKFSAVGGNSFDVVCRSRGRKQEPCAQSESNDSSL